jgi:hypothetical protein
MKQRLTTAVEQHASCAGKLVLLALLLHELLRNDIARPEQEGRRDGLRQERPRRQAGLVPFSRLVSFHRSAG